MSIAARIIADALKCSRDVPLCSVCAKGNGADWPTGALTVFAMAECAGCKTEQPTCAVSEWAWPGKGDVRLGREV